MIETTEVRVALNISTNRMKSEMIIKASFTFRLHVLPETNLTEKRMLAGASSGTGLSSETTPAADAGGGAEVAVASRESESDSESSASTVESGCVCGFDGAVATGSGFNVSYWMPIIPGEKRVSIP